MNVNLSEPFDMSLPVPVTRVSPPPLKVVGERSWWKCGRLARNETKYRTSSTPCKMRAPRAQEAAGARRCAPIRTNFLFYVSFSVAEGFEG